MRFSEDHGRDRPIEIIGGGLAGTEAAYQIASRGVPVVLWEMRPVQPTPAHKTNRLGELVCSNSFRSDAKNNPHHILKQELRGLNSLLLRTADECKVGAGQALAVDRNRFSEIVTQRIEGNSLIDVRRKEIESIPKDRVVIVATGPLTSDRLADHLQELFQEQPLYFFDAISPIVDADTIDREHVFSANRYGSGEGDYLNCPLTEKEYELFWQELLNGEMMEPHDFEQIPYFEGCLPVEVLGSRGKETLRFGPMKPVGLVDPKTNNRPHAVVQLRKENPEGSYYSLVGFQTKLRYPEQKRILQLIPALRNAEFARYGSLHRNTYINAPTLLQKTLRYKKDPNLFFAGQITGVEGYVESVATGIIAALNALEVHQKGPDASPTFPPTTTAIGALLGYLTQPAKGTFQPTNIHFGLFPPLEKKIKNRDVRKGKISARADHDFRKWLSNRTHVAA